MLLFNGLGINEVKLLSDFGTLRLVWAPIEEKKLLKPSAISYFAVTWLLFI